MKYIDAFRDPVAGKRTTLGGTRRSLVKGIDELCYVDKTLGDPAPADDGGLP